MLLLYAYLKYIFDSIRAIVNLIVVLTVKSDKYYLWKTVKAYTVEHNKPMLTICVF